MPPCPKTLAGSLALVLLSCSPGPPETHDVQGDQQYSPLQGRRVSLQGVVTAILPQEGLFLESENRDGSPATSEGLLVIGASAAVGDRVLVDGVVVEVQRNPEELPLTVLSVSPGSSSAPPSNEGAASASSSASSSGASILATGISLPEPASVVSRQETLDEAIEYWEAREGMRVLVEAATVLGPSSRFGETAVLVGEDVELPRDLAAWSARGAAVLVEGHYLPPRVLLDDSLVSLPLLAVGDRIGTPFVAVVDYRFGNYRLYPTAPLSGVDKANLEPEVAEPASPGALSIATLNVENLDPGDPGRRFADLARIVVEHLRAPELLALQEVQDDSGAEDDGEVGSEATHQRLISAIASLGGPGYAFREVRPANNQDGGEPWGNIRTSFLFRSNSGLSFVDRPDGEPTSRAASLGEEDGESVVSPSPGRIDPQHDSFRGSRKPLIGQFRWRGRPLFVINLHLSSKGGDDPAYGTNQPPRRLSETQRHRQANVVAGFVEQLLRRDRDAAVVVLGDFNDFHYSETLSRFEQAGLVNLIASLPPEERYTYVFQGQAQTLDHILVSPALAEDAQVDVVHVNAEWPAAERASDHDPVLARLQVPGR